jgi:DNA polymerase I
VWILDSCYREGVEIWDRKGGIQRHRIPYDPSFYLHFPDPHAHWQLVEALSERYSVEECSFRTVYGIHDGYRVEAGRAVADLIEKQSGHAARLYNVDIRLDQRYLAEMGMFPCGDPSESRFTPDFDLTLRCMEVAVRDNPHTSGVCTRIDVTCGTGDEQHLEGNEKTVLADLFGLVEAYDPEVILFPLADLWMARILDHARGYGLTPCISRTGRYRKLDAHSYRSYGRTEFRAGALIPDGRVLIDTRQSFNYREGGLRGVFLAARLTGLSPNLTARFTSGTLISTYEVYEAIRRGIAVPYRKGDPECVRRFTELRSADRGGMMFQPVPGLYGDVSQIDFTSLYPAVIVRYNLSPETLAHPEQEGFLPSVLAPLLDLRIKTKQRKKTDPGYAGLDGILKWMLVTCFGYTGYKNAKFGRIEVHEQITGRSRDILLQSKEIAEEMGFRVIHGIVDCLWVSGGPAGLLKARIEEETGLFTEREDYRWIVFLPMPDGFGAYNRYYGLLTDGSIKVRGIMVRKRDTPEYIRGMQHAMLEELREATDPAGLLAAEASVQAIYREAVAGLAAVSAQEMVIHRQVSRLLYTHRCAEGSAVRACEASGIPLSPGMEIGYVIRDARRWEVDLEWDANRFDLAYYRALLDKAWVEVSFAFSEAHHSSSAPGVPGNSL